jgi:hypothetical protein
MSLNGTQPSQIIRKKVSINEEANETKKFSHAIPIQTNPVFEISD